ncbi:nodal-related 2 [Embiotoca jacksoni]|uniref:nodal-related 2 n=1 Tax=Embiotoca jacksoni TaxID=100190 RepID=UPI00370419A7
MHLLGAQGVVLRASLLVLLVQGTPKSRDGAYMRTPHHFPLMDRSTGYQLPTYMMNLYRNFRANFSRPMDSMEQDAAKQADTVKSMLAKSLTYGKKRWVATFDLHALLTDKQIQAVELRIRLPRTQNASDIHVEVYHQHGQEQQLVGHLTESSVVSSTQNWRVFNVTSSLLNWLTPKLTSRYRDKRLSRRRKGVKKKRALTFPDLPLHLVRSRREQNVSDHALLVIFSDTGSDENSKAKASLLYTAEKSKFLSPAEIKRAYGPKRRRSKRGQTEQTAKSPQVSKDFCRRVDLHINFNQIGWGSWIIFPKRYEAYRCEGSCPDPLGEDLNPTNHAFMQSLLRHYHPDRVASPCCAPTKMSPLSMLYYENGEMLLRHHEDMIVDECGCQ